MTIIPFHDLYHTEYIITEPYVKVHNWYARNNFYSSLGKPKPSHTLLWFKNCRGVIIEKDGTELHVEKNQVAYMSKSTEYSVRFLDTAPRQDDTVVFHFQMTTDLNGDIAPTLHPTICIKNVDPSLATQIDTAAMEFYRNIVCPSVITSVIYQLLTHACQLQRNKTLKTKYKCILEGIELMESNSDKSLAEIAEICGISEGRFRKLFREYSGYNPIDFRQKYRIEKAKQLLLLDTLSIGEIAEELHFSDIYHFSKVFKKFCKCSPYHFRNSTNK